MSGMPLIYWAIKTALVSNEFNRVIVSTHDSQIAAIAIESGAEAPITRSADLADDFASTISVVADAIRRVDNLGDLEFTCCIYPRRSRAGSLRSPPGAGDRRILELESLRTRQGGSVADDLG